MKSGGQIYSFMFTAFGLSSLSGFFVAKFALKSIGYETFFFLAAFLTLCSLVLLYFFNDQPILTEKNDFIEDMQEEEPKVHLVNTQEQSDDNLRFNAWRLLIFINKMLISKPSPFLLPSNKDKSRILPSPG